MIVVGDWNGLEQRRRRLVCMGGRVPPRWIFRRIATKFLRVLRRPRWPPHGSVVFQAPLQQWFPEYGRSNDLIPEPLNPASHGHSLSIRIQTRPCKINLRNGRVCHDGYRLVRRTPEEHCHIRTIHPDVVGYQNLPTVATIRCGRRLPGNHGGVGDRPEDSIRQRTD